MEETNTPPEPPFVPEVTSLPADLIARWTALPPNTELSQPVTREDVDNLFFSINSLLRAHSNTQQALEGLFLMVSGIDAEGKVGTIRRSLIESNNHLVRFMASMMRNGLGE